MYYDDDDDEYNNITLISKSTCELVGILLETVINLIENYLTVNIDKIAERKWLRACVYHIIECFHARGLGWVVFSNNIAHGLYYEI